MIVESQGGELGDAGPQGVTQRRVELTGVDYPEALEREGQKGEGQNAPMAGSGRSRTWNASTLGRQVAAELNAAEVRASGGGECSSAVDT